MKERLMKEPITDSRRAKPRRRSKSKTTSKKRATKTRKRPAPAPQVNAASIFLQNIYWNGFDERGSFKISRTMIRRLLRTETLSAATLAALVKNLRRNGFLMSPLDRTSREWIVERIDPTKLPVVTDDVLRNAEERAIDLA
jgi:hypothetical protein